MATDEIIRDTHRQVRVYVTKLGSHLEDAYTADIVYTTKRLVVVPTDEREVFAGRGSGFGIAGTMIADALELYQRFRKDRRLDILLVSGLVANSLAIAIDFASVSRCSIQKWKKDWLQYLMMEGTDSRLEFEGSFDIFGTPGLATVSWTVNASPSALKKVIEDRLPVRATIVQGAL